MKDKSEAIKDFKAMIGKSWSYGRMTQDEREKLAAVFDSAQAEEIKGDYATRWAALQLAYRAFIGAIGYNGMKWREPHPEILPF